MSRIPASQSANLLSAIEQQRYRTGQTTVTGGPTNQYVNPSGPALARRQQQDQRAEAAGIDPARLRERIRRTRGDANVMRLQRRALGREAQAFELAGDRAAAERIRAEAAALEGDRVEMARGAAMEQRFLRTGRETPGMADRLRTEQTIEGDRRELGYDDQRTAIAVRQAGNEQARDMAEIQTNQIEGDRVMASDDLAFTNDTRANRRTARQTELDNTIRQLELDALDLQDRIANQPEDAAARRSLQAIEVRRQQLETERAAAEAETALAAETATRGNRVGTAEALSSVELGQAQRLARASGAGGQTAVVEALGLDTADPEQGAQAARYAFDIPEKLSTVRDKAYTDAVETDLDQMVTDLRLLALRATPEQQRAYARTVLSQILQNKSDGFQLDEAGFRGGLFNESARGQGPVIFKGPTQKRIEAGDRKYQQIIRMLQQMAGGVTGERAEPAGDGSP